MRNYVENAKEFAKKYGVKLSVIGEPEYKKHFPEDKAERWVFKMELSRGKKSYTFAFGQSIANGAEEPNMYDVLSCLQKVDPETFENFCSEFGYDQDSRTAERTYKAVCREYAGVLRVFPEIEDYDNELTQGLFEIN